MKEELWLIWKDSTSRRRYKIASLIKENNRYSFTYVYLDSSNNFTCDDSSYHRSIEIYEKVENVVTDKYQSTNTGGGE